MAPFKETQRAVILGETTWGSTGQTISTDFGNGMTLNVSTKRESFPDGSQFEGIGIMPTVGIHVTERDLSDGREEEIRFWKRHLPWLGREMPNGSWRKILIALTPEGIECKRQSEVARLAPLRVAQFRQGPVI